MSSRYPEATDSNLGNTKISSGGTTTASQSSSATGVENTSVQNMTPESLAALQGLISQLQSGGTNEILAEKAKRAQTQQVIEALLGQVSSGQAFEEAKGLMALNLQTAMEANAPSIQRAIEGSGTSAGSMQALLAQKLSRDSALSASALGAQQSQEYARQRSALANTLEAATRPTNDNTRALLGALNISKNAISNTQRSSSSSRTSTTNTTSPRSTETISYGSLPDVGAQSNTSGSGAIDQTISYDPNVYYSKLGRSGANEDLYTFLTGGNK